GKGARPLSRERNLSGNLPKLLERTGARREREHVTERAEHRISEQLSAGGPVAELARKRGHAYVSDSARHDKVEVGEVGAHIEREAVPGDPALGVDANGRQLAPAGPDTGESLT